MCWGHWGGCGIGVEDRAEEDADSAVVEGAEAGMAGGGGVAEERQEWFEDGAFGGGVVETAGIGGEGAVALTEDGIEVVGQQIEASPTGVVGGEIDGVIVVLAVGDIGFVRLEDGHHGEPAGPLVGFCDGVEGIEGIVGERSSGPCAGVGVVEGFAIEVRGGGGLPCEEEAGEVAPVVGGGVVLLRPAVEETVGSGGGGLGGAPEFVRAALFVEIAGGCEGPLASGHVAVDFLHADPFAVVLGTGGAAGLFDAVATEFDGQDVERGEAGCAEHFHADELEPWVFGIEIEVGDAVPRGIVGDRDAQWFELIVAAAVAADPHGGAVADGVIAGLRRDEGGIELAVAGGSAGGEAFEGGVFGGC